MSLLDWDYDEIAWRVQTGLDRLSVSFFRRHQARVRRDDVDFHGFEHVELEVEHDGHRLHVKQYARAQGPEDAPRPDQPVAVEELASTLDGRPSEEWPRTELARWLASLPAGEARVEVAAPNAEPNNPFASAKAPKPPPVRPTPAQNPFVAERPSGPAANPFAPAAGDERRERALDWLRGD